LRTRLIDIYVAKPDYSEQRIKVNYFSMEIKFIYYLSSIFCKGMIFASDPAGFGYKA